MSLKQDPTNIPRANVTVENILQNLYLKSPEDFLLVKIGANDGWMCDNLYDFIIKNDPTCVVIEPIPCYFEQLKINYSILKNASFENLAIDSTPGTREMFYIHNDKFQRGEVRFRLENQPHLWKEHWARGLGSFYESKNNLGCPELQVHAEKIEVKTETINNILNKYGAKNYKNLVIATDCEGHDLEILKSFDFTEHSPVLYTTEIGTHIRYPLSHPSHTLPHEEAQKHILYTQDQFNEAIHILNNNNLHVVINLENHDITGIHGDLYTSEEI